mmetsp:Transcript_22725/g.49654  ORF Transcript_22725/g.49654 Transcript_22725/m.49654 type:complete len:333 (-) Transcript_22725:518-1516(-)
MGKKIKGSGTKDARDLAASAAEKPRKTVTKAAKTTQPATPDEKAAKAARRAAKTEKRAIKAAKKATQSGISAISDLISDLGLSALPTEVQRFLRREEQEASKSPARRLSLKTGVERLSQLLVKRDFSFQGVEALENVKALLQHGADPNYKGDLKPDNYGIIREAPTPIHRAVHSRSVDVLKLLASHGGDVNASVDGCTPLQAALTEEVTERGALLETIAALVELGADVKVLDENGNTLMHLAVNQVNFTALYLFRELGVDAAQKNEKGQDILSLAVETKERMRKELEELEDWMEFQYESEREEGQEYEQALIGQYDDVLAAIPLLRTMVGKK